MNKFFESEFVKDELSDIADLQKKIFEKIFKFFSLSQEEKLNHISLLKKLIEKQKILYTCMCSSDDPNAKEMQNKIIESAETLGFSENILEILDHMEKIIENNKKQVDSK